MTRVLVPVAILKGESPSAGLIDLLGPTDVTVLGYHVLPEQTPPDQARAQFEDRAVSALEDLSAEFEAAGGDADHRLVFTHERRTSIERIAAETKSDAYTVSGATGSVERLLVPLSGDVAVARIIGFVTDLIDGRDIVVTLLGTSTDGQSDRTLENAAAELKAAGIDVATRSVAGKPFDALVDAVAGHDAIVMGERAPSLSSFVFGDEAERVAAASVGPVLVVRDPSAEDVDSPTG